ncbi:MAG: pyruvate kinase [Deltaproteobacteria bacterium]|nr:pyruvate kinase [Deltaproteobacteria bacterium]MBW2019099.1 pyruvate kinase [Deltaproteobacteria bacterium]MBW2073510.1 pyruvate kinase [Deltaproteobacteria bacterium]RLB80872.1 MAG: pyruvate kinase [Deltaproteobacteria bacterium]
MPRTKIVCTIGPASESPEVIRALIQNGMNVARLNFSHGSRREHKDKIRLIRSVSDELDQPVAIVQDLAGPKIRVGRLPDPGVRLETGQTFILTNQDVEGTSERVSVSYPNLPAEVREGDHILLADGFMELIVKGADRFNVYCEVITGGVLTSHKGLNLPTRTIQAPSLTEKDLKDLLFGLENEVDYVALSFVRKAEEIVTAKEVIRKSKKDTPVIAKIEKHEAVQRIDEILEAADGIMVARGDLGVEIPLESVPIVQKMLIRKANALGKPVITATQMLRSMVDSPRPTRAEATDVANAVLDGTDAVMLSEETANGNYPVRAVQFMSRIIESAEQGGLYEGPAKLTPKNDIPESVAHASCVVADCLDASAIVAPTQSGQTARQISRFRPARPIIALSPNQNTVRRLTLVWGCLPRLVADPKDTDDMFDKAAQSALETGQVSKGELVVITAGHPVAEPGSTNMIRVKRL